jgi:hypothetical protein
MHIIKKIKKNVYIAIYIISRVYVPEFAVNGIKLLHYFEVVFILICTL